MITPNSHRSLSIRHLTQKDLPMLLKLIKELAAFEKMSGRVTATEDRLRDSLLGSCPFAEGFMGFAENEAVAYAIVHHTYSTFAGAPGLYIEDIYVREEYRGHGYGKRLMEHLARLAVERGCKSMSWSVLEWNKPAIDFYMALGAGKNTEWDSYRIDGGRLRSLAGAES